VTPLDGLSLTEAEDAIQAAHPGWQVRPDHGIYAAYGTVTLPAPSVERVEQVIGQWEHDHPAVTR